MGIIISSFIGCGREFLKNTHGNKIKIFDAVEDILLDEKNKESLEKYYNTVMDSVDGNDIVFIGSSENIRSIFNENKVDYDVFYPSNDRRGEFIENQVRKRANPNVIRDIDKNFNEMVKSIDDDESENCYKHKMANRGEFIGNSPIIMQYIDSIKNSPKVQENVVKENNEVKNDEE